MIENTMIFVCVLVGVLAGLLFALGNRSAAILTGSICIIAFAGTTVLSAISDNGNTVAENSKDLPDIVQSVMQKLDPEGYVQRRVDSVGVLENIVLDRGMLSDTTIIETTEGFFTVNGIVKNTGKLPVFVSGLNDKRLEDKLCIGSELSKCYRLTGYGS